MEAKPGAGAAVAVPAPAVVAMPAKAATIATLRLAIFRELVLR